MLGDINEKLWLFAYLQNVLFKYLYAEKMFVFWQLSILCKRADGQNFKDVHILRLM